MRPIMILSVAMLLVVSFTEARLVMPETVREEEKTSAESVTQSESSDDTSQTSNSKQTTEASGEKSDCGQPIGDNIVLQWVETVDVKTARRVQNVIKKEKGRATGGKANGRETVKIIIEAKVNKSKADDWLDGLIKERPTCDAKSSSSDAQGEQGSNEDKDDAQDDNDGTSNSGDKHSEKDSSSESGDAEKASAGSGDK